LIPDAALVGAKLDMAANNIEHSTSSADVSRVEDLYVKKLSSILKRTSECTTAPCHIQYNEA
jgi:hypothetical protein